MTNLTADLQTFQWLKHFESNKGRNLKIERDEYQLTSTELRKITPSIQSFQLGESSEGTVLIAQAKAFVEQNGHPEYLECIRHLIREENRHSAYLGEFMRQHSIPKIRKGFNDRCFRFLRRLAGVEWSVRTLVIAEIIALTYYRALGQATKSTVLEKICARMCEEEKDHVRFQLFHIHEMNFRKHALSSSLANIAHALLFAVTLVPVWMEHRSVLSGEHDFRSFARTAWQDFQNYSGDAQDAAIRSLIKSGYLSESVLCI